MAEEEVFVPEDVEEHNVPEGEEYAEEPDLPDEEDPSFVAEVEAGDAEGEDDDDA